MISEGFKRMIELYCNTAHVPVVTDHLISKFKKKNFMMLWPVTASTCLSYPLHKGSSI